MHPFQATAPRFVRLLLNASRSAASNSACVSSSTHASSSSSFSHISNHRRNLLTTKHSAMSTVLENVVSKSTGPCVGRQPRVPIASTLTSTASTGPISKRHTLIPIDTCLRPFHYRIIPVITKFHRPRSILTRTVQRAVKLGGKCFDASWSAKWRAGVRRRDVKSQKDVNATKMLETRWRRGRASAQAVAAVSISPLCLRIY
ncbi:hypothetical protein FN846DRAFT_292051 [Sphaerosporella brunnea]|uniref:Uncharacterized protein n=1 Tax=Sphaerosporella brunnea TaxID=1250544 RepID=A0A5J5EM14_9PEZI|nr:hypothetical protein FN846DRAFT_292051 [Sphaerosporella brunnea]